MNTKTRIDTRYVAVSIMMLLGAVSHAQTPVHDMQKKTNEAVESLTSARSQESLFHYKKVIANQTATLKDKSDRILAYSKATKLLRGMLKADYDPTFVAPTSVPLPDPSLSSGSDPSQVVDPLKRQKAIEDSNVLAKKIAEHNFQRDLRKEIESINRKAKAEAGITDNDDSRVAVKKLMKAGLSSVDAEALLDVTPPANKSEQK